MKTTLLLITIFFFCGIIQAQINLNNGLVAHYPLNGTGNDISGNGFNAVSVNATSTSDRFGRENSAYYFSDYNHVINLGDILDSIFTTNTFSINLWFKADTLLSSSGYPSMLIGKWHTTPQIEDNSFILWSRNLRFVTGQNQSGLFFNNPSLEKWHMVTVSMDAQMASIYLDGVLQGVSASHGCSDSEYNLLIGNHFNNVYGFKGSIDDVRIYDRALSPKEIMALYNLNITEGLVAYYPLDGDTFDLSENNLHAVTSNATHTKDRLGRENSAFHFNGIDQVIDLGNVLNDVFVNGSFSVSMWFSAESIFNNSGTQPSMLMSKWFTSTETTNNNFILWTEYLRFSAGGNQIYLPLQNPSIKAWNMIAISMNEHTLSTYLNGVLIGTSSDNICNTSIYNLVIGGFRGNNYGFKGSIDDVRIYNRPLSETEIQGMYLHTLRAEFSSVSQTGFAPLTISFSDNSFSNNDIGTWKWDFDNDGVIDSQLQNPQFTYHTPGFYSVKLIVSDGLYSDTIIKQNYINVSGLQSGLAAFYPFNGNANDESGNGYNATSINASLTTDRFNSDNSAYYFNGDDNVIELGDILNNLFVTDNFTINIWFKAESLLSSSNRSGMLINKWLSAPGSVNNSFIIYAKELQFISGANHNGFAFNNPSLNNWHMLSASIYNGKVSIYLDGDYHGTIDHHKCFTSNQQLLIGNLHNGLYGFNGAIDDIVIYNRALTTQEILILYQLPEVEVVAPLLNFENTMVGQFSQSKSFTISAEDLPVDMYIKAPSGFKVSAYPNSGFVEQLILAPDNGIIDTTIYVRFEPELGQFYDSNISVMFGSILPKLVQVTGNGWTNINQMDNYAISIYPNPTTNNLNLVFNNLDNKKITITDINGKSILSESISGDKWSFDLSNLSNGIYLIKIINNNKFVKTYKIVKN